MARAVQQHNETAPGLRILQGHVESRQSLVPQQVHQVQVSLGKGSWERQ